MGFKVKRAILDTVGSPGAYKHLLIQRFNEMRIYGIDFIVESKADATYPVVSAASICAKVTRDHALLNWTLEESKLVVSTTYGCGYPGDPKTKQWMRDHIDRVFGYPTLVRFSWKTCQNAI